MLVADCLVNLPEFKREERKNFPENRLMLKTAVGLERKMRERLDLVKYERGLEPEEVYISRGVRGDVTVNLGLTLQNAQVIFPRDFNLKRLVASRLNPRYPYLFEEEFVRRYKKCWHQFNVLMDEIDLAERAKDVGQWEVVEALQILNEKYNNEFDVLKKLTLKNEDVRLKEEVQRNLANIRLLIAKLGRIHKARY